MRGRGRACENWVDDSMRSRAIVLRRHGPREVCSGNDDAIRRLVRIARVAALESRAGEFLCTDAHQLTIPAQTVRAVRHQQLNGRETEEVLSSR